MAKNFRRDIKKALFHYLPVIVPLFCFTFFLYWPVIRQPEILLGRHNDLEEQFWPMVDFTKNSLLKFKELPLWNNQILSGTPLLPDPQAPMHYLPNFIFLVMQINHAYLVSFFLHTFLAGVFFYLLLRQGFQINRQASLSAAILYLLSPRLVGYLEAGHVGLVFTWTWIPLAFLATKKIIDHPSLKSSIVLGLALSFLLATHTLIFAFTLFGLIFFLVINFNKKSNLFKNTITYFALGLLICFGLSARSLLPQWEWQKETTRNLLLQDRDVYPKWISKKEFVKSVFILSTKDTEKNLTLGISAIFLAFLGFLKLSRKRQLWVCFFVSSIIVISLNNASPFYDLLLKQKWFLLFRVATRGWFLINVLTLLLVSLGLARSGFRWRYLFFVVAIFESFFNNSRFLNKPIQPILTAPQSVYEYLKQDQSQFRVLCTTRCLSQNQNALYNLESIDGYNTLVQKNYVSHAWQLTGAYWNYYTLSIPPVGAYTFEKLQPSAKSLGEYNTKYVVSPHPLTDKGFKLVKTINRYHIYQNSFFQPRFPVPVISYSPNKIVLDISRYDKSTLTISEVYSPGWKAYIDNQTQTTVQETPEHLRQVTLSTNGQQLVFQYQPHTYQVGKLITWLTIISLLLGIAFKKVNTKTSFFKRIITS